MGTRNKRMLTEGAIPTIFCYSQPMKKCETSDKRQEKNKNSEIVEQLIAFTWNDNESDLHLQQETSNEFCHESSTDTNPVTVPLYASKKIALFKPTIQKPNWNLLKPSAPNRFLARTVRKKELLSK